MAKKKKSGMDMLYQACAPMEPTKAQIIASEAKYLGQRIAERDPNAIYWLDPAGDRTDDAVEPVPSVTLGFVVDQDAHRIRVASELGQHAALEGREYTAIQRAVIFAIKPLPRIHNPKVVYDEARART